MRLIDADAYKKQLGYICSAGDYQRRVLDVFIEWFTSILDNMPTAEPAPVVHAHWIVNEHGQPYCSNCNEVFLPYVLTEYCPHCGATMDEKEEG